MAKHSISEAARITGKSRSTLHRHIKIGKISKELADDGSPVIDTSELQRVYGALSHRHNGESIRAAQDDTPPASLSPTVELEVLRREVERLREERDRWAAQAESLTRLLTHQAPKQRTSWLGRLFSRD